jgi:hypothetical protein
MGIIMLFWRGKYTPMKMTLTVRRPNRKIGVFVVLGGGLFFRNFIGPFLIMERNGSYFKVVKYTENL